MKKLTVFKYINIVAGFLLAILMLIPWFTISAMGTVESHSFMTIPSLLKEGAEFLTQIGGKSIAVMVLLLSGVLEYMCIVVAAFGIWGGMRFMLYGRKSRLITASQIVASSLMFIALVAIIMIDYISATILGGIVRVVPTLGFLAGIICLIASIVSSVVYSKNIGRVGEYEEYYDEDEAQDYEESYEESYDESYEDDYDDTYHETEKQEE